VVDNTACRDFSELDTLQASSLLRRLRDRGLLEKQDAGTCSCMHQENHLMRNSEDAKRNG
jgi:hypothetical protein